MSKNQELKLVLELKKSCVQFDDGKKQKWRELEGKISAAAEIFRQLGLIYMKKNSSQRCIIQSAALFMAAQVRKYHEQTEKDLEKLWRTVLEKAGNQKRFISLNDVSRRMKKKVRHMRLQTKRSVNELPMLKFVESTKVMHKMEKEKIRNVKSIQEELSKSYIAFMEDVSEACLAILGKPKCEFALIGMGSLARKEVTPYSDFECFILLEEGVQYLSNYEEILERFRWFAVIFQLILISLGETILPAMAIPSLNDFYKLYKKRGGDWFYDDYTPRGISFDGFMPHASKTPLGDSLFNDKAETALIKPVSEMVKHLSRKSEVVLTETCFVCGDEELHAAFNVSAVAELKKQQSNKKTYVRFQKQLLKDLKKFDLEEQLGLLRFLNEMNIKKAFYRIPTIILSQYSKFFGFHCLSSFETISELRKNKKIQQRLEHKLKYVVAISCETRLKAYEKQQKQEELVKLFSIKDIKDTLIYLVGEKCVADFFIITLGLLYRYSSPSFLKRRKSFCIVDNASVTLRNQCLVYFVLGQYKNFWWILPNYLSQLEKKKKHLERDEVLCAAGITYFSSYEKTEAKRMFVELVLKRFIRSNPGHRNSFEADEKVYSVYCNCTDTIDSLWLSIANLSPFKSQLPLEFINDGKQFIEKVYCFFSNYIDMETQNKTIQNLVWSIISIKHLFLGTADFFLAVQALRWSLIRKNKQQQLFGRSKHSMMTRKRKADYERMERLQIRKRKK